MKAKFTKMSCPFGVVIAVDPTYPDSMVKYASNLVANILDPTGTGKAWSEDARLKFSANGGSMLGGGSTQALELPCDTLTGWDYCFSLQTWKVGGAADAEYFKASKAILMEEIFHFYTQKVLGRMFPTKFGDEWASDMCKETSRLTCVLPIGWSHPENTCPTGLAGKAATTPLKGGCNEPNCDCVEFFQQAVLLNNGQTPGWLGPAMPKT